MQPSKKTERLVIRVSSDIKKELSRRAAEESRSVNSLISHYLKIMVRK